MHFQLRRIIIHHLILYPRMGAARQNKPAPNTYPRYSIQNNLRVYLDKVKSRSDILHDQSSHAIVFHSMTNCLFIDKFTNLQIKNRFGRQCWSKLHHLCLWKKRPLAAILAASIFQNTILFPVHFSAYPFIFWFA